MNIEQVRTYCLALQGVTEDMPFGDDNITFRIEGKIFLCLSLGTENPHFALKLAPERNEELRELYSGIIPAFHWNKKHWSDVCYQQYDEQQVCTWIKESYTLLLRSLPKKIKEKYNEV